MPFRVRCTEAREEPISLIFKISKNLEEIKYAQQAIESGNLSINDVDQVFTGDNNLDRAHEEERTDPAGFHSGYPSGMSDCSETASLASDHSTESSSRSKQAQDFSHNVRHPWDVVDYHLYLCKMENGMDTYARRNNTYVYDGLDCRPILYSELCDQRAFHPSNIGDDPKFISWTLPVSNGKSSFKGRSYVLGFDYNSRTLFVRQFHWIPDSTDDIWCVWDEGFTVYRLTISDLIKVLDSVLSGKADVSRGILSSHTLCTIPRTGDDPGLEIVIAILLCQWVVDFATVFSGMDTVACDNFTKTLATYMEDCRRILQRASYRAWFASRDGHTMKDYSLMAAFDKYTNDLYTFSESAESGSLDAKSWHAPGLNTCKMLRRRDRSRRRELTVWQLEALFVRPASALPAESSEQVFKKMLARLEENAQPAFQLEPPQAPSPRPSPSGFTPRGSSVVEPSFTYGSPDFHRVPLILLLEHSLELIETYPGLDTPEIRRRFGSLLAEIGIDIVACLTDSPARSENNRLTYPYSVGGSQGAISRP